MKLNFNIGRADKLIRYAAAVSLITLNLTGVLTGIGGIVAVTVAIVLLATTLFNFCPLYAVFGWSTSKPNEKPPGKY